jgi:hypothetical protein
VKEEIHNYYGEENGGLRISSTSDLSPIFPENDIEVTEGIF